MNKAIIRIQKLKSPVAVRRSMKHAFREQPTPNADPQRSIENTHIGAQNVAEAMKRFNDSLPDKLRKNGVLMVEYLITASPEAMKSKDTAAQDAYFKDSLKWLQDKHGAGNLVYAGIHRDETTPHMYAYVMPKDHQGKLNCRSFFGEKDALSKMQTDFAERVGKEHGLERGLEGSRARHTDIGQYYARVNAATPLTPAIDVPSGKLLEGKEAYGQRVAQAVLDQMQPELVALKAKAQQNDLAQQQVKAAESGLRQAKLQVEEKEKLRLFERYTFDALAVRMKETLHIIGQGAEPLAKLQAEIRRQNDQKQEKSNDLEH